MIRVRAKGKGVSWSEKKVPSDRTRDLRGRMLETILDKKCHTTDEREALHKLSKNVTKPQVIHIRSIL